MKLGITGSRTITDFEFAQYFQLKNADFAAFLKKLGFTSISKIISGGASGVDSLAEGCANRISIPILRVDPDFEKYHGRMRFAAFGDRDEKIVEQADAMLVIWNGDISSHGTLYTMNAAIEDGLPVYMVKAQDGQILWEGVQTEIIEYPRRKRWKN